MGRFKYKVVRLSGKSIIVDPRSPFSLKYENEKITRAQNGTLGIMVFNTLRNARMWAKGFYLFDPNDYIIKRVIPHGRGKTPKRICHSVSAKNMREFYKDLKMFGYTYYTVTPPQGTICYPEVYVHSDVSL